MLHPHPAAMCENFWANYENVTKKEIMNVPLREIKANFNHIIMPKLLENVSNGPTSKSHLQTL